MITFLFICLMLVVFGRLLGLAIRMSWGIFKILLGIVFLPAAITTIFVSGLLYLAFPLLIAAGIVSLLLPGKKM